jgi:virginiamycin B lyase
MSGLSITSLAGVVLFMAGPLMAQSQPAQLPDGDGKQLVQGVCTACHEINQITRSSGYTREEWQELIQTMINLSGSPASDSIAKYLAAHFPAGS